MGKMTDPISKQMLATVGVACGDLRKRISQVSLKPYTSGHEEIFFHVDNVLRVGKMKGRNKYLCVGFGEKEDVAIALRVLLDGDSEIYDHKKEFTGGFCPPLPPPENKLRFLSTPSKKTAYYAHDNEANRETPQGVHQARR